MACGWGPRRGVARLNMLGLRRTSQHPRCCDRPAQEHLLTRLAGGLTIVCPDCQDIAAIGTDAIEPLIAEEEAGGDCAVEQAFVGGAALDFFRADAQGHLWPREGAVAIDFEFMRADAQPGLEIGRASCRER